MATNRIYLGLDEQTREVFRAEQEPTFATHGNRFAAVVGPFRTMRAAVFMRDYGQGNPHCQCVADAERIARAEQAKNRAA